MWSYGKDIIQEMDYFLPCGTAPIFTSLAQKNGQGWEATKIELTTLTGTYLETSSHLFNSQETIDKLKLKEFFKSALVLHIPKKKQQGINNADIKMALENYNIYPKDAIIINTGWYLKKNKRYYLKQSPYFEKSAIDYLIKKDISLLAADIPRFDYIEKSNLNIVSNILKNNILILAPVTNLQEVDVKRCDLLVFPLKLKNLCASPCRALLIYDKN